MSVLSDGSVETMSVRQPSAIAVDGVSVIVPCFNEEGAVQRTAEQLRQAFAAIPLRWEIVFVNDGSKDGTGQILDRLAASSTHMRVAHHAHRLGYGAALKRGIQLATYNRVVITDADGTYPIDQIGALISGLNAADMVVGARTGATVQIPVARRPAKWLLLKYARALTRSDIKDVNSGFRAVWMHHLRTVWPMLPDGFSFTSTLTIAMHIQQLEVEYLPISYFARIGQSSIRPLRDTLRFFSLIFRTVMYFKPLPVFGVLSLILIAAAILIGVAGKILTGAIPDVTVMSLFSTGVVFLGLGLLGDLINARRT
jgi:glycosyltransferase involved in cell wall biosynthesis